MRTRRIRLVVALTLSVALGCAGIPLGPLAGTLALANDATADDACAGGAQSGAADATTSAATTDDAPAGTIGEAWQSKAAASSDGQGAGAFLAGEKGRVAPQGLGVPDPTTVSASDRTTDAAPAAPVAAPVPRRAPSAQSGTCGDHLSWSYEDGTLTISGTGAMTDYAYSSTTGSTDAPWAGFVSSIQLLVIGEGVTSIGSAAFMDASSLATVSLPSTLTSIGSQAFFWCQSLTSVELPDALTSLGAGAFANCTSLASVSGGSYTELPDYVFQQTSIAEFTVSARITSVSSLAFFAGKLSSWQVERGNATYSARDGVLFADGGTTLVSWPTAKQASSYAVPEGTKKIEASAFQQSTFLGAVTLPDSLTEMGDFAFYLSGIRSVSFGSSLRSTGYGTFQRSRVERVSWGGVREVGALSFASCSELASVSLPAGVTAIGNGAFGECPALASFSSTALTQVPYQAFLNDKALTSLQLNEGVTHIYTQSFYNTGITSYTLPSSVVYVAPEAFSAGVKITPTHPGMGAFGANGYELLNRVTLRGTRRYDYAFQVLAQVNSERAKQGLSPLRMNQSLLDTAMMRGGELVVYFSHTRPDGEICWSANGLMSGENVACGQKDPSDVMTSWMGSQGHRANILSTRYTTVGIGCVEVNGTLYWAQCFGTGSDASSCAQPANATFSQRVDVAADEFLDTTSGQYARITYGLSYGDGRLKAGSSASPALVIQADSLSAPSDKGGTVNSCTTRRLTAASFDATACTWSSSTPSVATVSGSGVATGVSAGSAAITCSLGVSSAKATLVVTGTGSGTGSGGSGTGTNPGGGSGTTAGSFVDVYPSTAHSADIEWMARNGISTGWVRRDGTREFRPNASIARGDMAAFLHRLAGSPAARSASYGFRDVSSSTAHSADISWLASTGISTGWVRRDGTREFRPNASIARGDMAAFLYRLAGSPAFDPSASRLRFVDVGPSTSHYKEIMWLASTGVSTGWVRRDGTREFRPNAPIARGDAAAFMRRMSDKGLVARW